MTQINKLDINIGCHVGFRWLISDSIIDAINNGMYSMQFFMGNNKSIMNRAIISDNDIKKCNNLMNRFPINIFSHFPYCVNLAGIATEGKLAWIDCSIDYKMKKILKTIEYELFILSRLNCKRKGVVIHPGSWKNRKEGLLAICDSINKLDFSKLEDSDCHLILENSAGEGNKLCKNFEELSYIMNNIFTHQKKNIKICVDTAHIWGSGCYDLSKIKEVDRMFDEFDELIGLEYFYLLHLNDSKIDFGGRRDLHENIGRGCIWGNQIDSLVYLLKKCDNLKIPIILETHNNLSCLKLISRLI